MITVGQAVLQGSKVVLAPPSLGWGAVRAVRLTNYTQNVLILTNLSGQSQSQEYLLPLQQNVYESANVGVPPSITVLDVGGGIVTPPTVLVEWSTAPLDDFIGSYPTVIGAPSGTPYAYVSLEHVQPASSGPTTFSYMSIGANPFRKSITIVNDTDPLSVPGTGGLRWATSPASFLITPSPGIAPIMAVGSGRTLEYTGPIYIGFDGKVNVSAGQTDYTVELVEESYGAASLIDRLYDAP